jgi:hypothetical protein
MQLTLGGPRRPGVHERFLSSLLRSKERDRLRSTQGAVTSTSYRAARFVMHSVIVFTAE